MHVAIDFPHTLGAEVAFCYHFHLDLGTLNAVTLTDHCAESAVTTEVTVTSKSPRYTLS